MIVAARSAAVTLGFMVAVSSAGLASAESPVSAELVDRLVQPYLDAGVVDAVSIGIVKGDESMTRHYGKLSEATDEPPTDNTIYELGSISKVFTGILLADAVEAGRVKLDQPIGSLMTDLQELNKPVGDSILLRHLSLHSSGLPRVPLEILQADPTNPYRDYDRDRLTTFMGKVKPASKPGEKFEYSNLAAGLLGELLAIEADKNYGRLLDEQISEPLGLSDTTVLLTEQQRQRLAPPHNVDRMPDHNWDFDALAGCGAIHSTTSDMVQFIKANLHPPTSRLGRALELAWKEHRAATETDFAMGLGWHLARDGGTRWHNGQTGGYHTIIFVRRGIDTGLIVLCNTATPEVDNLATSVIQAVAGIPVTPREFAKTVSVPAESVVRLAGLYQIVPQFVLAVRAEGDKLFIQATGQPEFRIYANSQTEWSYRVVDAKITFDLSDQGKCTSLTLHQNGRDMPAPRIDP